MTCKKTLLYKEVYEGGRNSLLRCLWDYYELNVIIRSSLSVNCLFLAQQLVNDTALLWIISMSYRYVIFPLHAWWQEGRTEAGTWKRTIYPVDSMDMTTQRPVDEQIYQKNYWYTSWETIPWKDAGQIWVTGADIFIICLSPGSVCL